MVVSAHGLRLDSSVTSTATRHRPARFLDASRCSPRWTHSGGLFRCVVSRPPSTGFAAFRPRSARSPRPAALVRHAQSRSFDVCTRSTRALPTYVTREPLFARPTAPPSSSLSPRPPVCPERSPNFASIGAPHKAPTACHQASGIEYARRLAAFDSKGPRSLIATNSSRPGELPAGDCSPGCAGHAPFDAENPNRAAVRWPA